MSLVRRMARTANKAQRKPQKVIVRCTSCQKPVEFQKALQARPLPNDCLDVGIVCPNCQTFVHSHYDTPRIREAVARLKAAPADDLDSLRIKYKETFDTEQARMKGAA